MDLWICSAVCERSSQIRSSTLPSASERILLLTTLPPDVPKHWPGNNWIAWIWRKNPLRNWYSSVVGLISSRNWWKIYIFFKNINLNLLLELAAVEYAINERFYGVFQRRCVKSLPIYCKQIGRIQQLHFEISFALEQPLVRVQVTEFDIRINLPVLASTLK